MRTTVRKARADQDVLLGSRESISVSEQVASVLGVRPGAQVRIECKNSDMVGAYTIRMVHGKSDPAVRMAKRGRNQLDSTPGFEAEIRTTIPRSDMSFHEAWRQDECVETVWHDPTTDPAVVFIAPHGGDGERNTDEAAVYAAKAYDGSCSLWTVHNFDPSATGRWHITSSRIAPVSYPGLQSLRGGRFRRAISFHLWNGNEVIIGGLADHDVREDLAAAISKCINSIRDVITQNGKYMGNTEANVVNWLTADGRSGIHIEAPAYIYQRYRKRLGECVAEWL